MTVSIVIFEAFKNDQHLGDFMDTLGSQTSSYHSYGDNVIFAAHEGSSRDLFDALKAATPGRNGGLVVIEAKDIQDSSWSVDGNTFDWLNEALPNYKA